MRENIFNIILRIILVPFYIIGIIYLGIIICIGWGYDSLKNFLDEYWMYIK